MFRRLNLLLLFSFIIYSESPAVGSNLIPVTGKTGGNVTLTWESDARNISAVELSRLSENIPVCENEECKSGNGRVFKTGSCDIIIKGLIYSDAGKYILQVHYNNSQSKLEPQTLEYHLHIHDEISVQKGEDLKLDVLLINADKVERNSSEGWTEVWRRSHGVNSDRLTDRDGNLTINNFTVTDTGTYRVLDSNNKILITVSVTESSTGSKEKRETEDNKHNEQHKPLTIGLSVCGALLVLAGIIFSVYKIYQRQHRNTDHDDYQDVPREDIVQ